MNPLLPDYSGKKVYLVDSEPISNYWECLSFQRIMPGITVKSASSADRALEMLKGDLPVDFLSVAGSANFRGRGQPTLVEEVLSRNVLPKDKILIYSSTPECHRELAERIGVGLLEVNPNRPRQLAKYVAQRLSSQQGA
jgi:hypothetical protein